VAQPGNEGRASPVAVRCGIHQTLAAGSPAVAADHAGGGAGLVEEDQRRPVHEPLPNDASRGSGQIRPLLLGCPQALFLYVRSSLRSVDQIVVSETAGAPSALSSHLSSTSAYLGNRGHDGRRELLQDRILTIQHRSL